MSVEQPLFVPHQIVRLNCDLAYLYAEVIQLVEAKGLCWARPLLLWCCDRAHRDSLTAHSGYFDTCADCRLYDLRQLADLLWPADLFQPVLDTEAIPLLTHLHQPDHPCDQATDDHRPIQLASAKQLRQFVDQVWQSNIEQFKQM